jgi:aspartate aminotransferase-like enzyme
VYLLFIINALFLWVLGLSRNAAKMIAEIRSLGINLFKSARRLSCWRYILQCAFGPDDGQCRRPLGSTKKIIGSGSYGGNGSETHRIAVFGDTVRDPFKTTAEPSLNTVITVMSLVASMLAVLIVNHNLLELLGLQ